MNLDSTFTNSLQTWLNTPDNEKDWDAGALMLLQLSGNRIMYHNISINPRGKAEFIIGQLQKYLNFRLQKLTHEEVASMQEKVDEIAKSVIKPDLVVTPAGASELVDINSVSPNKSEEYAEFKAGKRADHDSLPENIQALYVENLDIVHRMRELHLKLRTLSLDGATCPDSERYPFLKEIIALDKKRVQNWDLYDHYIPGTSVNPEPAEENPTESSVNPEPASVNPDNSSVANTKKVATKRTAKKATSKKTVKSV